MKYKTYIERIAQYEKMMDEAIALIKSNDLNDELKDLIKELEQYYASNQWKLDFALDEAGELPSDLKRGVLSEDGLYNLFETYEELNIRNNSDE